MPPYLYNGNPIWVRRRLYIETGPAQFHTGYFGIIHPRVGVHGTAIELLCKENR